MRRKDITSEMMQEFIIGGLLSALREKAYNDVTVSEIVKKAGVNRSTYYRHFNSKEDIIRCFFDRIMSDYREEFEHSRDKSDFNYYTTLFAHFYKYKQQLLLCFKNNLTIYMLDVLHVWFCKKADNECTQNKNQFHIAYHIGGIYGCFRLWFLHDMKEQPKELAELSYSIMKGQKPLLL